jgi:GDP-D-mannose dehydratase
MGKRVLITRITGQDNSFLAASLLSKRSKAYGIIKRYSVFNTEKFDHLLSDGYIEGEPSIGQNLFRVNGDYYGI